MDIVSFLLIGVISGWLAGLIMKGHGFGMLVDLIVGIVGAVLGGFMLNIMGVYAYGFIGSIIMSVIGAVAFLFVVRLLTGSLGNRHSVGGL